MNAGWVAGNVRALAMSRRRLGRDAARRLASSTSLDEAVAILVGSPYGHDVRNGQTLAEAQRAVAETALWNVRVLAGWAPGPGVTMVRTLVGALEVANVADLLQRLAGAQTPPPYRLGMLATAWPRLAGAASAGEVRRVLAASPWGDPEGETAREIVLAMRMTLAQRVMAAAPAAAAWAIAATALLVARERIRDGRELPTRARTVAARVTGPATGAAATLPELAAALPPIARWALTDIAEPGALWRAEAHWWLHVETDGFRLARSAVTQPDVLLGVVALLAADAWRVRAALELAARGGAGREVFDEVA